MSLYPQSPQGIGTVLDAGFSLYRRSFKRVLPLSIAVAVLAQLPQLVQFATAASLDEFMAPATWPVAIAWLVVFVPYIAFMNGLYLSLDRIARDEPAPPFAVAFLRGLRKVLPVLLAGICYSLAIVLGLVLLIVPGVILMLSLSFYWYLILLEDAGIGESLSASHRLVWGNWWRTATVVTVAVLVYFAPQAILGAVAGIVFAIGSGMGEQTEPEALHAGIAGLMLAFGLIQALATALLLPMMASVLLVQLRDLQLRKSGADLVARAEAA